MRLSTNQNNPAALKVLIAANLANVKLDFEIVDVPPDTRHRPRLPVLLVNKQTRIFSTNAAIAYFMELAKAKISTSFDSLSNFEAENLAPLILCHLSEKGDSDLGLTKTLQKSLAFIEKLISQKFLTGSRVSYEDALIWSCLYPLIYSNDPVISIFPKILKWSKNMDEEKAFANAVKLLSPAVGKEAAKLILLCNPTASLSSYGERYLLPSSLVLQEQQIAAGVEHQELELTQDEINGAKSGWTGTLSTGSLRPKGIARILPVADEKNYFISSALPYVNNVPHLGNIIGCVLSADVFARYCRLRGRNTLYICGTDEYGTATETKALEEGLTTKEICDKYHRLHSEIYQWFNISFDFFGRTTTKEQTEIGQAIFLKLHSNGYLKSMSVEQLFCVPCQRFLSDRFVEGTCPVCKYEDARGDQCDKCGRLTNSTELINPRCKVCSSTNVVIKESDQYFLELPKLEEKECLAEWLDKISEGWTPNARSIAKSWMKEGLQDRCITRDLKWGTPVPMKGYEDKVFYVWFDAPIGYISITACYTTQWEQWWMNPEADIEYFQFMAKDNVPFHAILFPASLKGTHQPWTLVRHLIATEYLNYEDGKFSKSRGVGVFGNDAKEAGIPADIWRFYLLFIRPESQDSAFSWDDFMTKNNSELLNNLGNFVNRSLSFIEKFFSNTVPKMTLNEEDYRVVAQINREIQEYDALLDLCKLRDGLRQILAISRIGNQYFQANKPWTLNKDPADLPRCSTICGVGVQIVFLLSTLLEPYMPNVAKNIRQQLNMDAPIFTLNLQPLVPEGHVIGQPSPLFTKLDQEFINGLKLKYGGVQEKLDAAKTVKKTPEVVKGKKPSTAGAPKNKKK